jgi:hypothetical protein
MWSPWYQRAAAPMQMPLPESEPSASRGAGYDYLVIANSHDVRRSRSAQILHGLPGAQIEAQTVCTAGHGIAIENTSAQPRTPMRAPVCQRANLAVNFHDTQRGRTSDIRLEASQSSIR